jgi:hypothetical protein
MPWKPSRPGERPTLGWAVLDWMTETLAAPDRSEYEPFTPTRDQASFTLRLYELDPKTGRRRHRRAVYSRPKGSGKSPFLMAIVLAECIADVVFDGWDADGQPVGRPWADLRTPWGQVMAVSEDQTRNAWAPGLEMLRSGPACDLYPGLEPMDTFINLPAGRVEAVTASAASREGNRPIVALLDQTESWTSSNGGVRLAAVARRNLGKTGGVSVEAPNAYRPGEGSVAEASAQFAALIEGGKARDEGLLYDHREWPPETDMTDRASLLAGLRYAYGDAAADNGGWVDLDRIVAEIWDPATDPQDARQYYGNQVTHASDSWLSQPEWAACTDASIVVADSDPVTLGFDGSRSRSDATTDATALVACRVSDGHTWLVEAWEQPDNWTRQMGPWRVPTEQVDAVVRETVARFNVVGFYADPAKWESYVAKWEAEFGAALVVKATRQNPIEWWMTGGRSALTVRALEQFHGAVVDRELTHDGGSTLTRHVLNARRRVSRSGVQIAKDHPDSPRKIDAAVAAVLAWQARLDAIAAGVGRESPEEMFVPRRIR